MRELDFSWYSNPFELFIKKKGKSRIGLNALLCIPFCFSAASMEIYGQKKLKCHKKFHLLQIFVFCLLKPIHQSIFILYYIDIHPIIVNVCVLNKNSQ